MVDGIQHALGIMVGISKARKDPHEALAAYGEVQSIRDTLYSIETAKRKAELEALYETEKKEKENAILREENLNGQNKIVVAEKEKQQIFFGGLVLLLLAVIIVLMAFSRNRDKQKEKLRFLEKGRFKAVVTAEEKERIRIARELYDGLGQILSVAKMDVSTIENKVGAEQIKTIDSSIDLIDQTVREVRTVSHNLMPATLMKVGLVSALDELVLKINMVGQVQVVFNAKGLEERLPSNFEITIYRIVQEVINNALKHSLAKNIYIDLAKNKQQLYLSISDNGVSFEKDVIEKSSGIGWQNIFSRISMLGGKIDVDSKKDMGSTITIVLPVSN
jgi:two-component system NarL family sensor kinase